MKKIGFIGLGIMGKPMARNLIKAGFPLVVHNRSRGPVEELMKEGAEAAYSPKEVAQKAEVVITMLPDSPDVEKVILGENGVLEGARAGTILIDMSSISPIVSQRIAAEVAKKGVKMLDAPVSGGETGAINATLAIMVGGDQEVFDKCLDIFKAMGKSVVRVGNIGAGGFTKLANQIIAAINLEALGEAFVLGVKAGVDPNLIFQAIRGGLAGSNMMESRIPAIMERNFKPGFKLKLHLKDLNNALSAAKDLGVPLPITSLVQQMMLALTTRGLGEDDNGSLVKLLEDFAKTEIKKKS
ncbi:MAG TPA: 2-hydroxy-3-oxopropionate reductase [Candidatus Limnocylindrales bacterium]|nr:2-hydroxy-3-oxopropionate reductase [Candidatus Limnocylindrales bacterium]